MRVFLVKYSYNKSKWSGRATWPARRIIAENASDVVEIMNKRHSARCGFRIDSIEDVTGIPHEIRTTTVF
jgi:ribosomal protein S11